MAVYLRQQTKRELPVWLLQVIDVRNPFCCDMWVGVRLKVRYDTSKPLVCSPHALNVCIAYCVLRDLRRRRKSAGKIFGSGRIYFFRRIYGRPNFFSADFRRDQIFRRRRPNSAAGTSNQDVDFHHIIKGGMFSGATACCRPSFHGNAGISAENVFSHGKK